MEFSSLEAVKQCVMAGLGLSALPAISVASEVEQSRLLKLPWAGPDLTISAHMVWHKDKWLSPSLSAFLSMAREMLPLANPLVLSTNGEDHAEIGSEKA